MTRFCSKCGTAAGPDDRFCGACGNPLPAEGEPGVLAGPAMPAAEQPAAVTPITPVPPAATPAPEPPGMAERVEGVYRRVGDYLRAADIKFIENSRDRSYTALYGSAVAVVRVTPAGTDDTWVHFLAPVVSGARLQPDLFEYLVRKNADYAATKFHLSANNEIWLQYSVFGSILDANTCKHAAVFTMITADNEDDAIRARWGGRRAAEMLAGTVA